MARSRAPRLGGGLLAAAALLLGACERDTLYDGELTGPNVTVSSHTVSLSVKAPERMELTDSIRVAVTARDRDGGSGIARVGVTALVVNPARSDTTVFIVSEALPAPQSGAVVREFAFTPPHVDRFSLPATLSLELHAFAINGAGSCVAAVETASQRLACSELQEGFRAREVTGQKADVFVAAGRTLRLPEGGLIADALVSMSGNQPRLFLSNFSAHAVDVLDLRSERWTQVKVGAQPWGLAVDPSGSTLMVANSGGTNISFVPTATLSEDRSRRLETPNTVLFQITVAKDTLDQPRYQAQFLDFSDRPQFIAQDFTGLILYSTVPTGSAPTGTIRVAEQKVGWVRPEVRLLFNRKAVSEDLNNWAIANVDSLRVLAQAESDLVVIYDHVPGFPSQFLSSGALPLDQAIARMQALGSDIFAERGAWKVNEIGMSDTTFVAASEDRRRIAFGEGPTAPAGRIILWDAARRDVSNEISVADLVNNASERVLGVSLNQDGSLGVARGTEAAYFFNSDLRLQGMFGQGLQGGGGGATFKPNSSNAGNTLAFVGTPQRSIQLIETSHFLPRGEVRIRDNIVGPLRSSAPLAEDNQGLACPGDPRCVVVKLYGVTTSGVVVVDVREKDLAGR